MRATLKPELFLIFDTETKQFVTYGNKGAWITRSAAKGAYSIHTHGLDDKGHRCQLKFDSQNRFIIININAKSVP